MSKTRGKRAPEEKASFVDQTIRNLHKKTTAELAQIWRNALKLKGGPNFLLEIGRLLSAIEREWKRRRIRGELSEFFTWPSTAAPGGSGALTADGWPTEGLLQFMGYRVGRTHGENSSLRHSILKRFFSCELPPFYSPQYVDDWGSPASGPRLQKMAESLAAFTRNAKRRRDKRLSEAVRDWEQDLQFLYSEIYVGHFGFEWPTTAL